MKNIYIIKKDIDGIIFALQDNFSKKALISALNDYFSEEITLNVTILKFMKQGEMEVFLPESNTTETIYIEEVNLYN